MGSGLFHTLNIGEQALYTTRQGVDTASHNIANANVEGYSRQRVNLRSRDPQWTNGVIIGSGAYIKDITRSHNQFVEKQINRAHQISGEAAARYDGLKTLESIFSPDLAAGVSDEMTNFFNTFQDLSLNPNDTAIRTAVRENARNVVGAFKRVDSEVRQRRADLNDVVVQECSDLIFPATAAAALAAGNAATVLHPIAPSAAQSATVPVAQSLVPIRMSP